MADGYMRFLRTDADAYARDALKMTGGLVAVLVLLKLSEPYVASIASHDEMSFSFLDQSARYYATSMQDRQPLFALQHVTYALAYLNAARHMSNDSALEHRSGMDIQAFQVAVDTQRRATMRDAGKLCPKARLRGNFVHSTGWLG